MGKIENVQKRARVPTATGSRREQRANPELRALEKSHHSKFRREKDRQRDKDTETEKVEVTAGIKSRQDTREYHRRSH